MAVLVPGSILKGESLSFKIKAVIQEKKIIFPNRFNVFMFLRTNKHAHTSPQTSCFCANAKRAPHPVPCSPLCSVCVRACVCSCKYVIVGTSPSFKPTE